MIVSIAKELIDIQVPYRAIVATTTVIVVAFYYYGIVAVYYYKVDPLPNT